MKPQLRKDGRWYLLKQKNGVKQPFYDTTASGCINQAVAWDGTPSAKVSVSVGFNQWMVNEVAQKANATQSQYEYMGTFILPLMGAIKVGKVLPLNCQSVINKMNQQKLSTTTMRHARKVMHAYFEYERVMKHTIRENPCHDLKIPQRTTTRKRRSATPEELKILWDRMYGSFYFWCFQFLFITGLRPSEACGIKRTSIKGSSIHITEARTRRDVSDGKTHNAARTISVSPAVIDIINSQLAMLKEKHLENSEYLFPNLDGFPSNSALVYRAWARLREGTGIDLSLYELRHTFASIMYDHMPLKEIQEYIGHSGSMDTGETYAHIFRRGNIKSATRISRTMKQYIAK